jgi:hypothetical protein
MSEEGEKLMVFVDVDHTLGRYARKIHSIERSTRSKRIPMSGVAMPRVVGRVKRRRSEGSRTGSKPIAEIKAAGARKPAPAEFMVDS